MNLLNLIPILSGLLTKVLGFTTKMPKPYRRLLYVVAIVIGLVAIVSVFNPHVVAFLGLSAKGQKVIVSVVLFVLAVIARGNSGDPLITALEDATTEIAMAESNASRGNDAPLPVATVVEDVAKAVEPAAVAAVEQAAPALVPTIEAATAQNPAPTGAI